MRPVQCLECMKDAGTATHMDFLVDEQLGDVKNQWDSVDVLHNTTVVPWNFLPISAPLERLLLELFQLFEFQWANFNFRGMALRFVEIAMRGELWEVDADSD